MAQTTAWLLEIDDNSYIAIAEKAMIHIVLEPKLFHIPHTPQHCHQVILWQHELLPVVDLAVYLQQKPIERSQTFIAIVAYQKTPYNQSIHYGSLSLNSAPARIQVNDNQQCALPIEPKRWQQIAISCIQHQNNIVPIVDLTKVFS